MVDGGQIGEIYRMTPNPSVIWFGTLICCARAASGQGGEYRGALHDRHFI